jgi:hypothetical protein
VCEFTEDAVFGDRVGQDFGDSPVRGSRRDEEDEGSYFAGGEDALGLAGVTMIISKAAYITILMAYICFA